MNPQTTTYLVTVDTEKGTILEYHPAPTSSPTTTLIIMSGVQIAFLASILVLTLWMIGMKKITVDPKSQPPTS